MPVLLAYAIDDSIDIFGISGGGFEPPPGTPLECISSTERIARRLQSSQQLDDDHRLFVSPHH